MGDSSRTVAFGAGSGVLKRDCEPRKSAFLSLSFRFHFTAAAQPPLHRLSSHLATEENGTTLSPRRSQPNRAACFRTLQPPPQPLRFAMALRAGPGDGCDIQTASSTVLLPLPHPGRGSFGSYASLSVLTRVALRRGYFSPSLAMTSCVITVLGTTHSTASVAFE